ncbi:MAG: hypothetical protein KBE09_01440 [Candidatus Pacebacteria bacterium]|nr:hypothetical protein [Candidatus Paceibacterota bacterium]
MTLLAYIALLTGHAAYAASPFDPFVGYWKGNAVGKVSDGNQEGLTCTTNNSLQANDTLRIVLRCANAAGVSLKVYTTVKLSAGKLSGTWEERTYGVSGTVSGSLQESVLNALVDSPNYAAAIKITRTAGGLSVSVKPTKGTGSFVATLGS